MMRNATYGRMRLNRCIHRNYGYIGCSVSVLTDADRKCSGKRTCEIRVPNQEFTDSNSCPRDLKPYLEASYECINAVQPSVKICQPHSLVATPAGALSGIISSFTTMEYGVGVVECPWFIQAQPGQRISIDLYDFDRGTGSLSAICNAYAILREHSPEINTQRLTICNGVERTRHIYTSISNELEIRVLGGIKKTRHFLIKYTSKSEKDS